MRLAATTTNNYAIIVQDMDGVIVTWNGGAQRISGYLESEVRSQPIDFIFLPADREARVPLLERQRASQAGRAEDERWHVLSDGTEIYCSGVTTPIESDLFRGYAKISRDVTDRTGIESQKQLALTLERAIRAQSEAADRLKDEFFSVLSHELKNPLNLIHVKAELLTRIPDVRDISTYGTPPMPSSEPSRDRPGASTTCSTCRVYVPAVNGGQKATPDSGVDQKCETILFCRTVF